jgi:hypothetical protein
MAKRIPNSAEKKPVFLLKILFCFLVFFAAGQILTLAYGK